MNANSQQGSIVSADFVSVGSAFGTIFLDDIVALSLPDGLNYQTYCLNDTFFQGYYSLSLNNVGGWLVRKDMMNSGEIIVFDS